ncbi:hypothetical protein JYB62_09120 [Algoriphagus lutimaris]|uniref:hypothetical protein n=1 Tax=Algoriphagus lutimaris TaxID=613197 RepID=UPI00196A4416|nr:hypothetical protein [Algoriphagus lutimaris]MBN3520163.1 hypothetical protein [Algoriphagus lutimaris]
MKRFNFFFILLSIALASCQEDADKVISTDLPTEANQLFDLSNAWSESLYFALLSFDEYQAMDTASTLPGCPELLIEEDTRKVFLNFDAEIECEQAGNDKRSGKIVLEYALSNSNSATWTLEYDNYSFNGSSVKGIRSFKKDNSNQIIESFNPITLTTEEKLNSVFSGDIKHSGGTVFSNGIGFISGGNLHGVNPAGRDFNIEIPFDRLMLSSCFQENKLMPVAGSEVWSVSRGSSKNVTYQLQYELLDSCNVAANVILPDGRSLLLNP